MQSSSTKRYPGWIIIVLGIICMNFGYSCLVSVTGVFLNPVSQSLGVLIGDLAIYITIMSLTAVVGLAAISKFFNEKTIKPIMAISAALGAIAFVGFANAHSVVEFYLWAVPMGLCFCCMTTTPLQLLVNNWYGPKLRGRNMGIVFGVNSLCVCGIIPILNFIVQNYSWRIAYYVLAACLVICIPLILKFADWSPAQKGIKRIGDEEESDGVAPVLKGYEFKEGLKKPAVWLFFISSALLVVASASVLAYTQPCMESVGFDPIFASNTVSVAIGLTVITCILMGQISDKIGVRYAALVTGAAFALAFIAQLLIPSCGILMVVLFVLCYGIGSPAVNVVTPAMSNYICGDKNAAAFMGYANMFISIGGALSATIVGQIVNATGGYTVAFIFLAVLLAIVTIIRVIITLPQFKYHE